LESEADPKFAASVDVIPPPNKFTLAFNCSIRGSYRNSQVSYVVCALSDIIEFPVFINPTPTIGPAVAAEPIPEPLPIPLDPEAVLDEPVEPAPDELDPKEEDRPPEPEFEDDPEEDPKEEFKPPLDDEPDNPDDPKDELVEPAPLEEPPKLVLSIPPSGLPKKPFTVVLASPRWITRQSSLPVIGSIYRLRRKRILLVFSNCSIDVG
jgi:hypothetical protein